MLAMMVGSVLDGLWDRLSIQLIIKGGLQQEREKIYLFESHKPHNVDLINSHKQPHSPCTVAVAVINQTTAQKGGLIGDWWHTLISCFCSGNVAFFNCSHLEQSLS